ncbi:hypothetical protein RIF29_12709 [Crotalaria pallida]|uniref:Uncharacterized protein n=1 Tax=Crotalaria pallida TaxID=3830 RepID=A0AAN9INP0_CROPI
MISLPKTTPHAHHHHPSFLNPTTTTTTSSSFHHPCPFILSFRFYPSGLHPRLSALKAAADGSDSLVRKPLVKQEQHQQGSEFITVLDEQQHDNDSGKIKAANAYEEVELEDEEEEKWVDWEDQILEDTVPLVGFVRMILHSGQYESGQRLGPEHETTILEKLLPFHPEHEKKIGCGIDYITIGYHPNFERSRCLFIVRKDGELVDFSYWKCIKGLIRKNYPLYADSFILRHFRKRSPSL